MSLTKTGSASATQISKDDQQSIVRVTYTGTATENMRKTYESCQKNNKTYTKRASGIIFLKRNQVKALL